METFVKVSGCEVLSTDGRVLFCKVGEREISADKKFAVSQHVNGITVTLLASGKQSQFHLDLCDAFLSSGIPLFKLDHGKLRSFFGKYVKHQVPSSSALRKNYIRSKLDSIRSHVAGKFIWLSVDETTDATGRFVAHVVVGTMETTFSRSILLHCESLETTSGITISQVFVNSLTLLWLQQIQHDRVLLFVSDGAAYMKKAGTALEVDKLVSNGKKLFLKSAPRTTTFREKAPGIPLPPQPILTRWGTWITAAFYYAENFEAFAVVVQSMDASEAASIALAQGLLKDESLKRDLAFIRSHFGHLPPGIEKLEKKRLL
ncbi:uncharacterized protein LOC100901014 [Galendromus occidentalis]|uniref:Uncharacterized protein LOC100901014 n=1 Tax=Galendromus occidentalis TaxID=34638 RepID=A0AAJ6VWS3_9ACAR|nr:uncharacterized protein LOC100901014 [Galendromus occidentalis]